MDLLVHKPWRNKDLGSFADGFQVEIPRRGAVPLKIDRAALED